jgi:hypothetical protein
MVAVAIRYWEEEYMDHFEDDQWKEDEADFVEMPLQCSDEEGEELICCIYCGNMKPALSPDHDFCADCLSPASDHLEFMEDVILMRELSEE